MKRIRDQHQKIITHWSEFKELLDQKYLILAAFCGLPHCEDNIKKDSCGEECGETGAPVMGAKTLCIPLEQVQLVIFDQTIDKSLYIIDLFL